MGIQDKIAGRVATQVQGKTEELFKDLVRIQESMHAYLEKLLEVQRLQYELQCEQAKKKIPIWKDDEQ